MIKRIRHPLQRRKGVHLRTAKLLRGGLVFSFLLGAFVCLDRAEAQTYSEGKNEEGKPSVSDTRERTYSSNGQSTGTERIRVRGNGTTPADLVSGSRADYLQKDVDLGALGKQKSVLAPFSMMTTTHDVIMDQQLRTMGQTLQYMPSVNLESRGNGVFRLINRGYESDVEQNSRIDGLNAIITTPYATEQFDSVTVLNGAAGSIYGPQSPAGMMMMTQKRPTDKPFFNFNFGYDSNGSPLESLDTSVGKGPVKVRFNYMNQTGQLYTSNSNQWRDLYAGAIDVQVTKHTKLELNGSQYNSAVYGLPGSFAYGTWTKASKDKNGKTIPSVPSPGVMSGLPDAPNTNLPGYGTNDAGMAASTSVGTMVLKHDFTKTLHLKLGGLFEDAARNTLSVNNTMYNAGASQCSKAGISGPCLGQNMTSSAAANDFQTWSNYAHLNWDMTDPILHIRHHLNVGSVGYSLSNFNPLEAIVGMPGATGNKTPGATTPDYSGLYDPGDGQVAPGKYWNNANPSGKGEYKSMSTVVQNVMFGDSFDVGDYFTVMGQMSWGWIRQENFANNGSGSLSGAPVKVDGAFDPTVALTFHPTRRFSAYFNWGQDTAPGSGLSITDPVTGKNIQSMSPAATSTQYEGAIKYLWRDKFLVSLGGFGMSRPYTIGNTNANYLGNQDDMGMEFQVSGALTKELSMYGGVTYDHAVYKCGMNPALCAQNKITNGHSRVVGVAPWQSDFLLDWHPAWMHGVSFNSNIHYQGSRPANTENTSFADEYVTLDLGMRYVTHVVDHMLVLRGNIDNVTGEKYWASIWSKSLTGANNGGYSAEAGLPQTWHITASIYF